MGDKQQTYYMNSRAKLFQANLFITEKNAFFIATTGNSSIISWSLLERNTMRKNSIFSSTISMRTQTLISKACNFRQRIAWPEGPSNPALLKLFLLFVASLIFNIMVHFWVHGMDGIHSQTFIARYPMPYCSMPSKHLLNSHLRDCQRAQRVL